MDGPFALDALRRGASESGIALERNAQSEQAAQQCDAAPIIVAGSR